MRINDIEYIEVEVFDVRSSSQATEAFSMILVDKFNKQRYVPIIIGLNEARAILGELHGRLPQRPLTHALFADLLMNHIPDYNLEFISINEYSQGIYYASIVIQTPTGSYFEVDARPSDSTEYDENAIIFPTAAARQTPEAPKAQTEWETFSLSELKDMLQNAIDEENYELAAKIQEEIDKRG